MNFTDIRHQQRTLGRGSNWVMNEVLPAHSVAALRRSREGRLTTPSSARFRRHLRTTCVSFVFVLGMFAMAAPALAEHGGGGGGDAPAVEPVRVPRPETPDTRNQQVNRGRGGGCASCSAGDASSGVPTLLLSLFAVAFVRRPFVTR